MKRTLSLIAVLLSVLLALSSCSSLYYNLSAEPMAPYFDFDRSAYTGLTITVDKAYEITDEMVESYIESLLWENRGTTLSQKVKNGDEIGIYIRASYNGTPLPMGAVPAEFTALRTETGSEDDPYYYSYNFYDDDAVYITVGGGDGLPTVLREALFNITPNDTKRVASGGIVKKTDVVCLTHYAYYTKDNETVYYSTAVGSYYDLSTFSEGDMAWNAVGKVVGESFKYTEKKTIDGTEYEVTFECVVDTIIDEAKTLDVSHTLPLDAFAADSEYAYLNGQSITYHVVLSGIYRVPELNENFLLHTVGYKTEEDDVVAAFRRDLKDALVKEQKEDNIYAVLWAAVSSSLSPARYPDKLIRQTENSIRSILTNQQFLTQYEEAGYKSAEEYIRGYFGLTAEPYKDLPLEDALRTYIYDLRDEEMLYYYFLQVEEIQFTEEEYEQYLLRRTQDLQESSGLPYTPEAAEVYFDRYYGSGYLGTGFLRECLLYEHIAEFLYQNNTILFAAPEEKK